MTAPDPELRRMIDAVRDHDRPDGVDRERLLRELLAGAAAKPPARALSRGAGLKLAAGGLALVALALAAWPRTPPAPRGSDVPTAQPARPPARESAPIAVEREAPRATEGPSRSDADAAQETAAPAPAPAAPSAQPQTRARVASAPRATEDDEWRLLREADRALQARQPERALAVLARHAAAHPRGVGAPEAMAYRVRAFCMAGRAEEAAAVARELRRRAPDSPAAYSLRATCISDR